MIARPLPSALTRRLLAGLAAVALSLTAFSAAALKDDNQQPMLIEADTVEVDEAKSTSLYVGHVQVDQGTMHLLADQVTVHHRSDRRIKYIIARGNPASYQQQMEGDKGPVRAFAKRMDYDADRDELILTDEAILIQGTDRIASERIVYDRANARMQAGGGGRVKISITPDTKADSKPKPNAKLDAKANAKGSTKPAAAPKAPDQAAPAARGNR
jgi:lipopolysaccharide export system protein LptA